MINNNWCCSKCWRGGKLFKQAQKTTTKPTALMKATAMNHTVMDFLTGRPEDCGIKTQVS